MIYMFVSVVSYLIVVQKVYFRRNNTSHQVDYIGALMLDIFEFVGQNKTFDDVILS